MRALALDFESRTLDWRDTAEPALRDDCEVLFRVQEVGVCGTDRALAAFRLGRPPVGERYLTLGHEALGQVIEIGSAVTSFSRGDWVVPTVRRSCLPACVSCTRRRRDLCVTGRYTERGILGLNGYFTERAVDLEEDLVQVPPALVDFGILIEPLSVAEKAIARAIGICEGAPRRALVLGLGPLGILSAMVLKLRGCQVRVHSLEPLDHPRVALLRSQDIEYEPVLSDSPAEIVIEATGSADLALAMLGKMSPLAVMVVLGAFDTSGPLPFMRMILNNQTVTGSVNADPASFRNAVEDLARFDRRVLEALITRSRFSDLGGSLTGPALTAAKVVHVLDDPLH